MILVYGASTCLFHNASLVLNQYKASDFPTSFGGNVSNRQWPTRSSIKATVGTCILPPSPRLSILIHHTFYTITSHPILHSPKKPNFKMCAPAKTETKPQATAKVPVDASREPQCCHCGWRGDHSPDCPFGSSPPVRCVFVLL